MPRNLPSLFRLNVAGRVTSPEYFHFGNYEDMTSEEPAGPEVRTNNVAKRYFVLPRI